MSEEFPLTDFYVSVNGERGEEFRRVLGTNRVCVESPVAILATLPIGQRRVYLMHLPALTREQRAALVSHLAAKFDLPPSEVDRDLDADGMPILAEDCDVTIYNLQRWV